MNRYIRFKNGETKWVGDSEYNMLIENEIVVRVERVSQYKRGI